MRADANDEYRAGSSWARRSGGRVASALRRADRADRARLLGNRTVVRPSGPVSFRRGAARRSADGSTAVGCAARMNGEERFAARFAAPHLDRVVLVLVLVRVSLTAT